MKKIILLAFVMFTCNTLTPEFLTAQELTLSKIGASKSGNITVTASISGAPGFSGCNLNLKAGKSTLDLENGLGDTVYSFTAASSNTFPFSITYSGVDTVYKSKVFFKTTLECDDFVIDSNIQNKNLKKRLTNAKITNKFAKFVSKLLEKIDSGA